MKMPASIGIDRPFPTIAAADRYLAIGAIEDARKRLCRMIERSEGLGIAVGPPGTGKTLLCQRLAAQHRSSHVVVMLGDIRVSTRSGLIQQLLFQLRLPHQGLDEQAMLMALVESLTQTSDTARTLLLLIDEAQMLTSETLDEIRMLSNLIRDGRPLVQTILFGTLRLEDTLTDPQLESLTQRIAARCYLHPLNQAESAQYIRSMVSTMGLTADDDAIASTHHACGGIPRLINQLMNAAIDYVSLHRQRSITDLAIQHAWAELQQLPSPVIEPKLKPRAEIEFGELDEAPAMPVMPASLRGSTMQAFDAENESSIATPAAMQSAMPNAMPAAEPAATYVDIEAILSSPIVCLPDTPEASAFMPMTQPTSAPAMKSFAPGSMYGSAAMTPGYDSEFTPIVPRKSPKERKLNRDELFGIDFSDEMLVDVRLADAASKKNKAMHQGRGQQEPAAAELSLHSEIIQMSQTAKAASQPRAATSGRASLPWAPTPKIVEETMDTLPADSTDITVPMAIVWSDDEPGPMAMDDRDILVIEDEVAVILDGPAGTSIGNAGLRKPNLQVDQQYQSLFTKLRSVKPE